MKPSFEHSLEKALLGGAALIQLREKDMDAVIYSYMAQLTRRLCHQYDAEMLINGRPKMAQQLSADGLHLPEFVLEEDSLPPFPVRGVSVHQLENAKRAEAQGVQYLIFGPVFATSSHPDTEPAGLDALHQITQAVKCPVYAIGGISASNAKSCLDAGAYGVAVMSAVWNAADQTEAVRELLQSISPNTPASRD